MKFHYIMSTMESMRVSYKALAYSLIVWCHVMSQCKILMSCAITDWCCWGKRTTETPRSENWQEWDFCGARSRYRINDAVHVVQRVTCTYIALFYKYLQLRECDMTTISEGGLGDLPQNILEIYSSNGAIWGISLQNFEARSRPVSRDMDKQKHR